MDNSENRPQDVFFYGLYMDPNLLEDKNIAANNPRLAVVRDYHLRIGKMATLLRSPGKLCIGMLYSMTHEEIHRLYWGAGLDAYVAEAVLANVVDDRIRQYSALSDIEDVYRSIDAFSVDRVAALCCNLIVPPAEDESNTAYQEKLSNVMRQLKIPMPDELMLTIH